MTSSSLLTYLHLWQEYFNCLKRFQ